MSRTLHLTPIVPPLPDDIELSGRSYQDRRYFEFDGSDQRMGPGHHQQVRYAPYAPGEAMREGGTCLYSTPMRLGTYAQTVAGDPDFGAEPSPRMWVWGTWSEP